MARKRRGAQRSQNTIDDLASKIQNIRWLIGVAVSVAGILVAVVLAVVFSNQPLNEVDLKRYMDNHSSHVPIVRNLLVKEAYDLLSDVHVTEIGADSSLTRNLREVRESLKNVRGFDRQNLGLQEILDLVVGMATSPNAAAEDRFLRIDPRTLDFTPIEVGYFFTFQGLVRMKRAREHNDVRMQLAELDRAIALLLTARDLTPRISNLWNGLGICYLERASITADTSLIDLATNCFAMAYELYRSPTNLAARINNLSYSTMVATVFEMVDVKTVDDFRLILTVRNPEAAERHMNQLVQALQDFDRASLQAPGVVSILLSKAEAYCTAAICSASAAGSKGDVIAIEDPNEYMDKAMELLREARSEGYREWNYLFSRLWVANTLLKVEKYRAELREFVAS